MEFFSPEHGYTMKYNPVTGETCDVAEPNQTQLEISTEGISPSNLERTKELVQKPIGKYNLSYISLLNPGEKVNAPKTLGENYGNAEPVPDSDNPRPSKPPHSYKNSSTGAPLFPSSLSTSHVPSSTTIQPKSTPDLVSNADDKASAGSAFFPSLRFTPVA